MAFIKQVGKSAITRIGPHRARTGAAAVLRTASAVGNGRWTKRIRQAEWTLPHHQITLDATETVRRHGLTLELDLADNVQRSLFYTGWYEPEFVRFLLGEVRRDDVYLDIGAHIGIDAMLVAQRLRALGGGHVIAVEATPDSSAKMQRLLEMNDLHDLVTIIAKAVGDEPGEATIYADPEWSERDASVRSMYTTEGVPVFTVEVVTVDSVLEELTPRRVDIVKYDIEGAESKAHKGTIGLLSDPARRPRLVIVEMNYRLERAGTSADEVIALLESLGYAPTGDVLLENHVFRPKHLR